MMDYFYSVLRDTCNDLREDLHRQPEKEKKLRDRLTKAYQIIVDFYDMRNLNNIKLAIEMTEKCAGELKGYFDKALYFHYSARNEDEEYSHLAHHVKSNRMTPENAMVLIFLSNGIFFDFIDDANRYRIYENEIFDVLPYEFFDLKLVAKDNLKIMKYDKKRKLYDYSKPSFYQAPAIRDVTPDENDVDIMKRLQDFDEMLISVSKEECEDKSKYSFAKHYALADQLLEILIDAFSDEELTLAFSERKTQEIIEIIRSLDSDRKKRIMNSLPEIKKNIVTSEMKGHEEYDESDYIAKVIFFKTAGTCIWGYHLNQNSCFSMYGRVFENFDKGTDTKKLENDMERANQSYAQAVSWRNSYMVNRGRFF